jgi:uncharacterized membrane protein required for colicin V production
MPMTSLTLGPLLVAAAADGSRGLFGCAALAAAVLAFFWFHLLLSKSVAGGSDKMVGSVFGLLAAPFLSIWLVARLGSAEAVAVACLYVTCYSVVQSATAAVKWTVLRRRPIAALKAELSTVRRHFPLAAESKYIAQVVGGELTFAAQYTFH